MLKVEAKSRLGKTPPVARELQFTVEAPRPGAGAMIAMLLALVAMLQTPAAPPAAMELNA